MIWNPIEFGLPQISNIYNVTYYSTIRNAISIGGDSDTIAAITVSIAEAYYGISSEMKKKALCYLDDFFKCIILA